MKTKTISYISEKLDRDFNRESTTKRVFKKIDRWLFKKFYAFLQAINDLNGYLYYHFPKNGYKEMKAAEFWANLHKHQQKRIIASIRSEYGLDAGKAEIEINNLKNGSL